MRCSEPPPLYALSVRPAVSVSGPAVRACHCQITLSSFHLTKKCPRSFLVPIQMINFKIIWKSYFPFFKMYHESSLKEINRLLMNQLEKIKLTNISFWPFLYERLSSARSTSYCRHSYFLHTDLATENDKTNDIS